MKIKFLLFSNVPSISIGYQINIVFLDFLMYRKITKKIKIYFKVTFGHQRQKPDMHTLRGKTLLIEILFHLGYKLYNIIPNYTVYLARTFCRHIRLCALPIGRATL